MCICDFNLNFAILFKKLLKKYTTIENKLTNKHFIDLYTFQNYNFSFVNSIEDINEFKNKNKEIINKCIDLDEKALDGKPEGKLQGWCSCCNKKVDFLWILLPKYNEQILFSETFICPQCGMKNRIRAIIHLFKIFENSKPKNKRIYCYEYYTQFFKYLYSNYSKDNEIIGSEYFGTNKKSGEYVNGVLHEDCMALSFNDNEFDYIFSNDVFEHVADINKTLSEARRCLKKGGKLIFRIPIDWNKEKTVKLAELKDCEITFLAPPSYHGGFSYTNPNGSLVFYEYGCDIFEILKNAGFSKTYGIAIEDEKFGNIGIDPIVVFVCEK